MEPAKEELIDIVDRTRLIPTEALLEYEPTLKQSADKLWAGEFTREQVGRLLEMLYSHGVGTGMAKTLEVAKELYEPEHVHVWKFLNGRDCFYCHECGAVEQGE